MSDPIQIILYGNSLFLSGVELTLRQRSAWAVLHLDPAYPGVPAELAALQRGVLIYDVADVEVQFAPAFLAAHPHMVVVGLDAAQGRALIWRGERRRIARLDDLSDLLLDVQRSEQE